MTNLGRVVFNQGRKNEGKALLRQALQVGEESEQLPLILEVLALVAKLLMDKERIKPAIRLLTIAVTHPATEQAVRQEAKGLLQQLNKAAPLTSTTDQEMSSEPNSLDELVKEAFA
jgi:hypothetical protein